MRPHIIVTTDFSGSSRNALDYACALATKGDYKILLLHIYTVPITYTSDGIALTSVYEAFDHAETLLKEEQQWASENFHYINIEIKATTGGLIENLQDEISNGRPELVIMGAVSNYDDLWMWDSELLKALTSLPAPVLIVPMHVRYNEIHNIGFASDYRNVCSLRQISFIKWLTIYSAAQLHVVHITRSKPQDEVVKQENEALLHDALQDATPKYYAIEDPNIIEALAHFVKEQQIDLLIVVPHKHGLWGSITHQSHTKQLAKLNSIPVLALPEL